MAKTLDPVHPNEGDRIAYQRKLDALIRDMHRSVAYWVLAKYRANTPEIVAMDASPAMTLRVLMRKLSRRWLKRFDDLAPELATYFADLSTDRSDVALRQAMKRAGWTVKFRPTRAQNDAYQAIIGENVGLIKSIPSDYLTQVEGMVMRSVQAGRDLSEVSALMEERYGITARRAAFIARDQNNKATAVMTRVRQDSLGITEAVWVHSAGGKEPRATHVAAGQAQTRYKVSEGWYDPDLGRNIWPGTEPNCRCVCRSVIPGLG